MPASSMSRAFRLVPRQLLTLEFGDRKDFDDPTHVEHLGATLPALHSLGR